MCICVCVCVCVCVWVCVGCHRYRFFRTHPCYKALFKKLSHLDDEEKMRENETFETEAMTFFNTLDEVMACIDGKVDAAIHILRAAGLQYVNMEGFTGAQYFTVIHVLSGNVTTSPFSTSGCKNPTFWRI